MVKVASIKNIIKDLTPRQQKTMRSHARHHTLKHMRSMARLMSGRRKLNFSQAHTIAMRRVGKWVDLQQHLHWQKWLTKDQWEKGEEVAKKRKRRKVPKDKDSGLPKKYLSGLKGGKRSARASLIKSMSSLYKSGARIPRSMFRARARSGY